MNRRLRVSLSMERAMDILNEKKNAITLVRITEGTWLIH